MNSVSSIHAYDSAVDTSGWLLLLIDDYLIGLRQSEAASVLVSSGVLPEFDNLSSGLTEFNGKNWPVFDVNKHMIPVSQVSEERKFCVLLKDNHGFMGIMCDATTTLTQKEDLEIKAMPDSLGQGVSPFDAVAVRNGELILITQASNFTEYLRKISELMNKKRVPSGTD